MDQTGASVEWWQLVVAVIAILAGGVSGWVALNNSVVTVTTKQSAIEQRVSKNEVYDGYVTDRLDAQKEDIVRNQENINRLSTDVGEVAVGLKDVVKEMKDLNENLTVLIIENKYRGNTNAKERSNQSNSN